MTDYVPGRGTLWLQNKAREEAPVVSTPKKARGKVKPAEPEASPDENSGSEDSAE